MKNCFFALLLSALTSAYASDYQIGADLSGMRPDDKFIDGGVEKPGLQVFRDHGYNWVRYRLWHTPTRGPQNLSYVISQAKEAKARGFFDTEKRALPVLDVFNRWTRPAHRTDGQ